MYPKFGPGQLWEHVAGQIRGMGGELHTGWKVEQVQVCRVATVAGGSRG